MSRAGSRWRDRGSALAVLGIGLLIGVAGCKPGSAGQDLGSPDPELERRVAELLPQVEELSGLSAARTPEVRRASRSTLEAYLLDRLEMEYPGDSIESLQAAYRAFGLLADTVVLRDLLVELLLEQAIGYYDPSVDVLFIREEVLPAALDGVIVHELVHALQDQHIDLDSLMRAREGNDARTAAQGAAEGHATVVMFAYMIGAATGSPATVDRLPELGPELSGALGDASAMPLLSGAPAVIRETLLFAYLGGARFVQRLWKAEPDRPAPIGRWMPESTEQLIHTSKILVDRDPPTRLELTDEEASGWRRRYASDLGELELRIYFQEHLGDETLAERAAAGWDGDVYVLLEKDGEQALVWYTLWDTATDADEFVDAYRSAFLARYDAVQEDGVLLGDGRRARVERVELNGRPVIRVVESPAEIVPTPLPEAFIP